MTSFDHLTNWLNEVKTKSNPDIKVFLIGNKADLEENRKISLQEAEKFCKNNNLQFFTETSAKTGFNAKNVFIEAAKCLYIEYIKSMNLNSKLSTNTMPTQKSQIPLPKVLDKDKVNNTEKKSCC